jgi:hypothetical protein
MNFGGLSPSQIMFTETGKIKMGLGLYYHFPNINSNNIYYLKSNNKAKYLFFYVLVFLILMLLNINL